MLPRAVYLQKLTVVCIVAALILNLLFWLSYSPPGGAMSDGGGVSVVVKSVSLKEDGSLDLSLTLKLGDTQQIAVVTENAVPRDSATTATPIDATKTIHQLFPKIKYSIGNYKRCLLAKDIDTVIYLHTSPSNIKRRDSLRHTWLNTTIFQKDNIRYVFMMGLPTSTLEQEAIVKESALYNDIVQGDFVDHYRNLSFKAVTSLHWISTYCASAKYVIKADDDAFFNIFNYLTRIAIPENICKRTVICHVWKANTMKILRKGGVDKCMKWCVEKEYFAGEKMYPQYCSGLAFIMTSDLVREMYLSSFSTPFFWVDDVYTTGMLTQRLPEVTFIDIIKNNTLNITEARLSLSQPPSGLMAAHTGQHHSYMYELWNLTLANLPDNAARLIREDVHFYHRTTQTPVASTTAGVPSEEYASRAHVKKQKTIQPATGELTPKAEATEPR